MYDNDIIDELDCESSRYLDIDVAYSSYESNYFESSNSGTYLDGDEYSSDNDVDSMPRQRSFHSLPWLVF